MENVFASTHFQITGLSKICELKQRI